MKHAHVVALVLGTVVVSGAGYLLGRQSAMQVDSMATAQASNPAGERKVLYWQDPMVPGPRFDKPGKSPFMDMPLVPVYAEDQGGAAVKVSPEVQQNLGIRTAMVTRTEVAASFDAVGTVQFDERLTEAVQTRVSGYVERLLVRAPMEYVHRGQPLATIFAPDWLGPQNEYLALKRAGASGELVTAARERIRALSIPDALFLQSEASGTAQARFTVVAPVGGVIAELGARDGVAVSPGMTLFRIAGLDRVWAVADVPEAQAMTLRRGQHAKATSQVDSSQSFEGQLKEILPQVNANTRTVQARFDVPNTGGRLMPGMLLRLQVAAPTTTRLVVPAEAVIRTGTRAVVIAQKSSGVFEAREVSLGADMGDQLEVLRGLEDGERVVVSGQFLVDSEARLKAVLGSMPSQPGPEVLSTSGQPADSSATFSAQGKVESVDAEGVTISHGPVPPLKWPAMTMSFGKDRPADFPKLKSGDSVQFEFKKGGPMGWVLISVQPTGERK